MTQLFEPFARLAGPGIVALLLLLLSPTTVLGCATAGYGMAALPNVVGGAVSLLMVVTLLRHTKNKHITRFEFLGASSLAIAGALAASDIGIFGFSLAFGFLVLGSALYGVYFRHRRIQLIPAHQLAQGIGATAAVLTPFLPLAGAISAMTSSLSPLTVIGCSGIASALVLLIELVVTSKSGRASQSILDTR